ncbi:MAG: metallophosphoesterase [Oligoflexales bacterium]
MNKNIFKFCLCLIFIDTTFNITFGNSSTTNNSLTFLAFGDGGTGNSKQKKVADSMVRICSIQGCDFAIMLGDNIYNDGVDNVDDEQFQTKFEVPYGPLAIPFYVALGNHDARGNTQAQIDYTERSLWWNMPARYYAETIEDLMIIAIDSNDFGEDQRQFLADQLENSSASLNIVYGHHPIYSYGSHGHTSYLVDDLLPILCEYPNVVYISGHDHDLQVLDSECGVPLFVSGAAAKLRKTNYGRRTVWSESTYGYTLFSYNSGILNVRYYSEDDEILFDRIYSFSDNEQLTEKVISFDGNWSYHDQNLDPGLSWMTEDFDHGTWPQGNAHLGYGDGDEQTVIAGGSPSVYFRRYFEISEGLSWARLKVHHDDGVAIWINGRKVTEKHMAKGLDHDSYASSQSKDNELTILDMDTKLLNEGLNTIAVMVKQRSPTSSDVSFDLELTANYLQTPLPSSIEFGSDWLYHDLDYSPSASWQQSDFDDRSWALGTAQLGYGDGDEKTEIAQGSPSAYFRKKIYIAEEIAWANLKVLHDDGVAVWINGEIVLAKHMNNGLEHGVYASSQSGENELTNIELDANLFQKGSNTIAVMIKQHSATSSDISFDLELTPNYDKDPLPKSIAFGSDWQYHAIDQSPGVNWFEKSYDDENWQQGKAELGYGDGDEKTEISKGSPSAYFRKEILISDGIQWAQLKVRHDDGVAVWINGQKIWEKYMNNGIEHNVYASRQSQDNELSTIDLPPSLFQEGANTIAVMLKQHSATSSDLSFDLELLTNYDGNPPPPAEDGIVHIGTTEIRDSRGVINIQRPSGSKQGDLLVLFLHRTDDDLPLFVDGWKRVAECYKTNNGHQCATEPDCTNWHNDYFCEKFGSKGNGHDLAQSVFIREVKPGEKDSYHFNLNLDSSGHPGWAILTALRGADTRNPVRDWSTTGCDKNADSIFPSVYGESGDMLLLSQSFDDAIAKSKFGAPSGTSTIGYVSKSDEAGFLFAGILGNSGNTGNKKTQGVGGPSCKDALVSITIKAK